jgi:hypothetical protein
VDELYLITTSGRVRQAIQELGQFATEEEFDRNFLVDHLAAVLQQYGRMQGQNLRLGAL